ncbi:uncharacterized protein LOC143254916 [Tachypleus tridentatus]|uniref:uncharacterized protein LOC143254916 n=1 Tax=Tachypleus tridentatus TaxID=6853 RepID=UPI003FD2154B
MSAIYDYSSTPKSSMPSVILDGLLTNFSHRQIIAFIDHHKPDVSVDPRKTRILRQGLSEPSVVVFPTSTTYFKLARCEIHKIQVMLNFTTRWGAEEKQKFFERPSLSREPSRVRKT